MERDLTAVTNKNRPGGATPGEDFEDTEVHSITDAATAHSEEMRSRMVKYALAMGIRMVCLVLIFVVDGWFKILPVIGAVFLPWFAVVVANGNDKAEVHSESLIDYVPLGQLEGPPPAESFGDMPDDDGPVTLLQGEIIDDDDDDEDHRRAAS
ncbi:DUF3099 domain-containing protein [Arthrobacter sp. BPSS-3]|uniref:DUF3099 domain-containing protein n=1 Tax=Arthrobacter sp. BPSS-3 TaxID=3366580 RepID=UPI0037DD57AD